MKQQLKHFLAIFFGWLFVALGLIGVLLPIVPTTPFLIAALALFSTSSPKFHQMLLNNRWVGPPLRQWDESKTLARTTKYKASVMLVLGICVSIVILSGRPWHQAMLVLIAIVVLFFIWRIKESPQ